jgi:hypothetical protein
MKPILIIATLLTFLLSACGAKATPTPDVQATAISAASTMVAETQAAMPTETPIPPTDTPTDTPQPTPTIPPLPTSQVIASPTVAPSGGTSGDPCHGYLNVSKGDKLATILVNNKTNKLIGLSFRLYKNAFGDCGYWSTTMGASSSKLITNLPIGCYDVNAFVLGQGFQNYTYYCDTIPDKYTLNVTGNNPIGVIAP